MFSLNRETEEEKAFISAKNRIFFQPLSQYTRYVQHIHWPYTYSSIGELFLYRNACVRTVCMWVPQLFLYKSPSLAIASWQLRCVVCVSYLGTITFARYIVLSVRGIVFRALPVCMRSVVFGCLVSSVAVLVSLPVSLSALSFFRLDCVELRQFAFKTPFLEA